ncbi:hypothetical protein [Algoriphagus resistens]|uniref:hypothetical protein n=1 Tax=Algoriphagus resistens TaxID=1750590 RepID=UPI0007168DEC|nr:hypothetical protein [Algoriphagus resistens]
MKNDKQLPPGFSKLYVELSIIHTLITVHAIDQKAYSRKHEIAKGFITDLLSQIKDDGVLSLLLEKWLKDGSTKRLRDIILLYVDYRNDYIPHFNAMVLLDDICIQYREIKARAERKGGEDEG